MQDILGTEPDEVEDKVQLKIEKSKIYRNHDILDEREQEVIRGRFDLNGGGDERTQREIARELGISRSYESRIEKRALMKLYHELIVYTSCRSPAINVESTRKFGRIFRNFMEYLSLFITTYGGCVYLWLMQDA